MKFDFVRIFHKVWDIDTKYVTYYMLWGIGTNSSRVKFTKFEFAVRQSI